MGVGKHCVCGFLLFWFLCVSGLEQKDSPFCAFPAIYNFGDSNSDPGGISAAFVPIFGPYGEGFFHKPSGRDSDGCLIIDFTAEKLKLPYLSAYLNSLGTNCRHGANFATGGSIIRRQNETIFEHGISPFSLDIQIVQFNSSKHAPLSSTNKLRTHTKEANFQYQRSSRRLSTHTTLVKMISLLASER